MSKAEQVMSGGSLMKRWNIDVFELFECIAQGLPAYRREYNELKDFDTGPGGDYVVELTVPTLLFHPSDVQHFEKENEWLLERAAGREDMALSAEEKRELGRLRREKAKWDKSIEAAVQIGRLCANIDHEITRAELADRIYEIDDRIPNTTIDKIWKSIPEEHRKAAGAPKKKKDE